MEYFWLIIGAVITVFTMVDTFFTVLNYNERGLLVNRFIRWEWRVVRTLISALPIHKRRWFLRQVTGLVLVSAISLWLSGLILGFALMFYGAAGLGALTHTGGRIGFWESVYLSLGQFSTVGADQFTPVKTWVAILTVCETLLSIVFLSMVITFLFNIYNCIQALRTLCASFPSRHTNVTSPLDELSPYFPHRGSNSLELHLVELRSNLNSYFDSLAQDHPGFFFQSGADRFSMPFAVFMTAGTIEGLRYGIPQSHPAAQEPELPRLCDSFEGSLSQIVDRYNWEIPQTSNALSLEQFSDEYQRSYGSGSDVDQYVARFRRLVSSMSAMDTAPKDDDNSTSDLYFRYCHWLTFITRVDAFVAEASRELLYAPTYIPGAYQSQPPVTSFGWQIKQSDPIHQ